MAILREEAPVALVFNCNTALNIRFESKGT